MIEQIPSQCDMCSDPIPFGFGFIALPCLCVFARVRAFVCVMVWLPCHSALCPYTPALYYLIHGHCSLSSTLWCLRLNINKCTTLTNGVSSFSRLWLCTFTLSVAVCAVLLLPISILSNEVLLTFPQSYYMQWLNGSLIHGTSVFFKQGWHQTKHQIEICFKTGTEWTVVMPSRSILNRPVSKLIIITDREAVTSLFNSVKFSNLSGMPVSHCEEL